MGNKICVPEETDLRDRSNSLLTTVNKSRSNARKSLRRGGRKSKHIKSMQDNVL